MRYRTLWSLVLTPILCAPLVAQDSLHLVRHGTDLGCRDRLIREHAVFADLGHWTVARLDAAGAAGLRTAGLPVRAVTEPAPGEQLAALLPALAGALPSGVRVLLAESEFTLVAAPPAALAALERPGVFHGGVVAIDLTRRYLPAPATLPAVGPLAPDPRIAAWVASAQQANLQTHVQTLSNLYTRHTTRPENAQAISYVTNLLAAMPSLSVHTETFNSSYGPNLIAEQPGLETPADIVIVGAHLDSLVFGGAAARAPGADDNGSGSATVLEIARILSAVPLQKTVRFAWWNAEELGLFGSTAYANAARTRGDRILAYLNSDMNAYRQSGYAATMHFVTNDSTTTLMDFLTTVSQTYVPGLAVGRGGLSGGSSDHASFFRAGFPSVFYFEPVSRYSPYIHSASDTLGTSANDLAQSLLFTQSVLAGAAEIALPLPAPTFTLDVTSGPTVGGTAVTATGTFVRSASSVKVGGRSVAFTKTATTVQFATPTSAVTGSVVVEISNPAGAGTAAFAYAPTAPPALRMPAQLALGTGATGAVGGQPGHASVTLLSPVNGPTALGPIVLDVGGGNPANLLFFHVGVLVADGGTVEFPVQVPNDPGLHGATLWFQSVLVDPATLALAKTNVGPLQIP